MSYKFLGIQLFLISLLSLISGYQIPDLNDSNWQTAMFLTPYGIIDNFLHKDQSVLWTFYFDASAGQTQLSTMSSFSMLVVYFVLLFSAYKLVIQKGQDT